MQYQHYVSLVTGGDIMGWRTDREDRSQGCNLSVKGSRSLIPTSDLMPVSQAVVTVLQCA